MTPFLLKILSTQRRCLEREASKFISRSIESSDAGQMVSTRSVAGTSAMQTWQLSSEGSDMLPEMSRCRGSG